MLDAFTKKRIEKFLNNYIDQKIPKHLKRDIQIKYKFRGDTITLTQERPSFMPGQRVELPIAQFRLDNSFWKVYWKDSRDKWHFVDDIKPNENFEEQVKAVDKNDIFWA
ncbi:DUF3024 domain-containing protein [Cohnella silvisoli]|uniref:DUF3024 domain-containing protein n=1 Tax=Cohnella silvisoli TaxID=2873699 RepID=A0ABV1L1M2_9BACL|nr:DUF3024 domain-containing protein [Cohnella silvisoli]MCD9025457.1 DUF3024 domain-containing protein [Cohnella silvisoli]